MHLLVRPILVLAISLAAPLATRGGQAARPAGSVLAYSAARSSRLAPNSHVRIAAIDVTLAAGDALEYDLNVPVACVERAGVVLVDEGNERIGRADAPVVGSWTHVVEPLDVHAGRRIRAVEIVALGARTDDVGLRVDNVVLRRAAGAIDVFRDDLVDRRWLVRDEASGAGVAVAPLEPDSGRASTRLDSSRVVEPWAAFELSTLRRLAASAGPARPLDFFGLALVASGVPMRFSGPGEPESFACARQRVSFQPLDGGRFYWIYLALSCEGADAITDRAFVYGDGGARREIELSIGRRLDGGFETLPREGFAGARFAIVELALAADFPVRGLELPEDPRLRVHAVSVCWRKDGASDSRFRLAWLAREVATARDLDPKRKTRLARYLANRRIGPLFADVPGEDEAERRLFDARVSRDDAKFDPLLEERLETQAEVGAPLKKLRLTFQDARAASGSRAALLGEFAAEFGPETLVRALVAAGLYVDPNASGAGAQIRIGADLSYLRQAPQLLTSIGVSSAIGPGALDLAHWTGADGSKVLVAAPLGTLGEDLTREAKMWRKWATLAREGTTNADALVLLPRDDELEREASLWSTELIESDVAPRVRFATTEQFVRDVIHRPGTRVQEMVSGNLLPIDPSRAQSVREHVAALRRAETLLAESETFGALAQADGFALSIDDLVRARRRLALEPVAREIIAIGDTARDVVAASLRILARAAKTNGGGTPIVAFNPVAWTRRSLIEIADDSAICLDDRGQPVPAQRNAGGASIFQIETPALGYSIARLLRAGSGAAGAAAVSPVSVDGWTVRNDVVSFSLDPKTGELQSVKDVVNGAETLSAPARLVSGRESADAWRLESITAVERGPLRATVRAEHVSTRGRVAVEYTLCAGARRIEVRARSSGAADDAAPSLTLPLLHAGPRALVSVPFGFATTARAAHESERFLLRDWALATDAQGGLAVLAGSATTFGYRESALAVDLSGATDVTFALMPIGPQWRRAGVEQEALELARPPVLVTDTVHDGARPTRQSFVTLSRSTAFGKPIEGPGSGVMMSALAPAADGDGWMLRLVELQGEQASVRLQFDRPIFHVKLCDLREFPIADLKTEGHRIEITLAPQRVETLRFRLRP